MKWISGIVNCITLQETDFTVIDEVAYSSTSGDRYWKFLGITIYHYKFNAGIKDVNYVDKNAGGKSSIGFSKKKEK